MSKGPEKEASETLPSDDAVLPCLHGENRTVRILKHLNRSTYSWVSRELTSQSAQRNRLIISALNVQYNTRFPRERTIHVTTTFPKAQNNHKENSMVLSQVILLQVSVYQGTQQRRQGSVLQQEGHLVQPMERRDSIPYADSVPQAVNTYTSD